MTIWDTASVCIYSSAAGLSVGPEMILSSSCHALMELVDFALVSWQLFHKPPLPTGIMVCKPTYRVHCLLRMHSCGRGLQDLFDWWSNRMLLVLDWPSWMRILLQLLAWQSPSLPGPASLTMDCFLFLLITWQKYEILEAERVCLLFKLHIPGRWDISLSYSTKCFLPFLIRN